MPRRIGLFGGTFDPVHIGHLVAAQNARYELSLDVVLLIVANKPWQKVGEREVSPATDRLALVSAAVSGLDGLEASDLEVARGGLSYTLDTVQELLEKEPDAELFLIVGADVVPKLATWEKVEVLAGLVELVVMNRPGSASGPGDPALSAWRTRFVEMPALEISSTDLRERAATGRPLEFLIPDTAIRVMKERGLYARDRWVPTGD